MLEDAWNDGLIAFVSGEPGSGKSRLMQEFMRFQGEFVMLENRPGDAGVPYASLARHLRALFKHQPVTLEVWASTELSRILPELGGEPSPIHSEQGKLRFLQAIAHAFQSVIRTRNATTALVYDDAQFTDTSSSEATRFVLEQLEPPDRERLRILYGYHKNELSPELEARVKHSLVTGEGALIELEALDETALVSLLQSSSTRFETNDLTGIAETLRRFTGGNPLFMLETIKALGETRGTEPWTQQSLEVLQSSGGLPRTLKVKQVIERRLERLSKPAKDLLRVAAVMGQEYTLERAAKVLEADQLVLAEASEELEVVGIVRANRFTHDLLFEASYEGVPKAAKPLLHSRVLDGLEAVKAPASELVKHAFGAGNHKGIVQYSFQAAHDAKDLWALTESISHLDRLRNYHLKSMQGTGGRSLLATSEVARLYELLRLYHVWSIEYDQARVLADEYFQFVDAIGATEEMCIALFLMGGEFGLELYSASERLNFSKQAVDFAEKSGRDDLLAMSEIAVSFAITSVISTKNSPILPNGRVLAVEHAKRALSSAKRYASQSREVHPLISELRYSVEMVVWIQMFLSFALQDTNAFTEAEQLQEQILESDQALEVPRNIPWHSYCLALTKISLGKLTQAEKLCLQAIDTVEQWVRIRRYLVYIPVFSVYVQCGKYTEIQIALNQLEDTSPEDQAKRLFRQYEGMVAFLSFAFEDAKRMWLEGLVHDKRMPESLTSYFFESALCAASVMLEDWADALKYANQAISARDYQTLPSDVGSCDHWHFETISLLQAGEIDTARADIQARAPHVIKWPRYLLPHLRSEAVLHRFENHLDTALEKLQQALEVAQTIGLPREIWEITSDIARLLEWQGHTSLASDARAQAVAVRDSLVVNVPEEMRTRYLEFTDGQIHATTFLDEQ